MRAITLEDIEALAKDRSCRKLVRRDGQVTFSFVAYVPEADEHEQLVVMNNTTKQVSLWNLYGARYPKPSAGDILIEDGYER